MVISTEYFKKYAIESNYNVQYVQEETMSPTGTGEVKFLIQFTTRVKLFTTYKKVDNIF